MLVFFFLLFSSVRSGDISFFRLPIAVDSLIRDIQCEDEECGWVPFNLPSTNMAFPPTLRNGEAAGASGV